MITIEVDDKEYTDFKAASVFRSVDTLAGSFQFEASPKPGIKYPIRVAQACEVFVDGVRQINGFVEGVGVSYSPSGHQITISGRDKSADLIDSTVGPDVDLNGPISLGGISRATIKAMGLRMDVIENVASLEIFKSTEIASAELDKTGFDFLESFSKQRQAFITGDGNGNLVITRAGTTKAVTALQNIIGGEQNNIKSSSTNNDDVARFNRYQVQAQLNPSSSDVSFGAATIVDQTGSAIDGDIRSTRRLYFVAEESADGTTSKQRAEWEANIRRAQSRKYTATVAGFSQEDGSLWQPNTLVTVNDEFASIKADMLIWSTSFSYDLGGGSVTTLECVPPDALSLIAQELISQKKTDKIGSPFDNFVPEEAS